MRPLAIALAAFALSASPAAADVRISGSSTMLPVVADLAFFYQRSVPDPPRFVITGGGSEVGAADAARGIADIGLVARPRGPEDRPRLVFRRLAISGICLVTNRANPLPLITRAQVRDVVAGRLTSWAQLPGSPRTDAIVPIASAPGTGVRRSFEDTLLGEGDPVAYRPLTLVSVGQIRTAVLGGPAALGYTDLSGTRGLHAVPLDGVPCTRATVAAGEYPARRVLSLVTRRRPSAETARFIRWARSSRRAHRIVARTFALP